MQNSDKMYIFLRNIEKHFKIADQAKKTISTAKYNVIMELIANTKKMTSIADIDISLSKHPKEYKTKLPPGIEKTAFTS